LAFCSTSRKPGVVELGVPHAVVLVDVDVVGPQRAEGLSSCSLHVGRRAGLGPPHVPVELVAELRRDHPLVPAAGDRAADQRLGQVVAVALGRVDEVDPEVGRPGEHGGDLVLGEVLAPLAAELPGADADDRHAEVGRSEPAVFHGGEGTGGRARPTRSVRTNS
jgi:hypothetical protein